MQDKVNSINEHVFLNLDDCCLILHLHLIEEEETQCFITENLFVGKCCGLSLYWSLVQSIISFSLQAQFYTIYPSLESNPTIILFSFLQSGE